jgi:hypothetical protein
MMTNIIPAMSDAELQRALKAARALGQREKPHWAYDINLHLALQEEHERRQRLQAKEGEAA